MAGSDRMRAAWERGVSRWPDLGLDLDGFSARAGDFDDAHAEDLYLATACLAGLAPAIAAFRGAFRPLLQQAVARVERRGGTAADLADDLLAELLVGEPPAPPKLASYSGRGPLRTWLRMIATRRALNASRDLTRHAQIDRRLARETVRTSSDPEAALLKAQYGPRFEAALRASLAALPAATRALLRLHHGEGLGLSAIATMNGWSKPTAGRRLAEARETLLVAARRRLQDELRVTRSELESLLRALRSDLHVSLAGLLAETPP